MEENIQTLVWQKLVCCMDEGCFSDEEWQWLVDNVKPKDY